ncbi:MAG TPA: hypothetical protein VMH32_03700 [Burkholderiales bacterium]|nr:hypothetical protein [Burkholderiales bacterium]
MSTPQSDTRTRRVLLAFDLRAPFTSSLSAARALVEALGAELSGLFVEDINLLRLAALPFTREVGATSGVSRPIELPDVERVLRLQADAARQALSELAAELAVPWSFRVERGDLVDRVLAEMSETVAAVLVPPVLARKREAPSGKHSEQRRPAGQRLLALWDRSAAGVETVAMTMRLAAVQHATVTLAVVDGEPHPKSLVSLLASAPPGTRVLSLARSDPAVLAGQLRAAGCDLLLLSWTALERDRDRMRALIEGAGSPVVLLG